jgi:glutamate--cysteine ligase catalytic subunit
MAWNDSQISARTGSLLTTASWIRRFVRSHPAYAHDSVVSQEINYDLVREIDAIERGAVRADDLLGPDYIGSEAYDAGGKDPIHADCA